MYCKNYTKHINRL